MCYIYIYIYRERERERNGGELGEWDAGFEWVREREKEREIIVNLRLGNILYDLSFSQFYGFFV